MKTNKFYKITLLILLSLMLTACKKESTTDNPTEVETDINIDIPNNVETTPTVTPTTSATNTETTPTVVPETTETTEVPTTTDLSSIEQLQDAVTKNNKMESFINQVKVLQESNLITLFNSLAIGASNKEVRETIQNGGYRYMNNVKLNYLYDEAGSLLNMEERKGLIVFTSTKLDLEKETSKLTTTEKFADAKNDDIVVDVKNGSDFDSFIVFVFNADNVLVGKFKYLLSENGVKKDIDILGGSLTYDNAFPLTIAETSDIKTIYEKLDTIRIESEKLRENISTLTEAVKESFLSTYNSLDENSTVETLIKSVQDNKLGIEKMNTSNLKPFNDRLLKSYTEGYYIFLTKEDSKTSPDLRYNNVYITVIFDENDKLYYRNIFSNDLNEEVCVDIKDAEDYSLKDLYTEISNLQTKIDKYEEEKKVFYNYLEKNLILLNKTVDYSFSYEKLITEIKKTGLTYEENYNNLAVTKAKNSKGKNIELTNDSGVKIYDNCIMVSSELRSIYFFMKENKLIAIYRSDYFDISEVKTTEYKKLTVIKKGLEQLKEEEYLVQNEMKSYTNMVSDKLATFISNIGFSKNHKDGQLYKQVDIIQALDNSGFRYEEGMNKGDGLYFLGIYALKDDTKYAYKIYFNESLEAELIQ